MISASATKVDTVPGAGFAVGASMLLATVVLIAKVLVARMSPWTFTTFFFAFGSLWYCVYFLVRGELSVFRPSRAAILAGLCVGVIDSGFTLAYFTALQTLSPAVAAFLGHMADFFSIALGVLLLRERFTSKEGIALFLAIGGLVVMTARTDAVVMRGAALMLFSGLCFAVNAIVIKRFTRTHAPIALSFYRAVALTVVLGTLSLTVLDVKMPPRDTLPLLALAGFVGPFLNYLCFFNALKRLAVSLVGVIRASYSLIVLVGAYAIFAAMPAPRQILGGLMLFGGVMWLLVSRMLAAQPAGR